jgi:hypothetical protein
VRQFRISDFELLPNVDSFDCPLVQFLKCQILNTGRVDKSTFGDAIRNQRFEIGRTSGVRGVFAPRGGLAFLGGQLSRCEVAGTTANRVVITFGINLDRSEGPIFAGIR